jgi:4-amino-4-deoxy-L-arabinose transferase-like glycosyltransferase
VVRLIPLGVALVAATLYLAGLGDAPFLDPPEGFHAEIAREMAASGDVVTLRLNGVRYFEKPPLPYWLMASGFSVAGVHPASARVWPALGAVGCAALTAALGVLLGGPRVGLVAGLVVTANLGMYVHGRLVKPDLIFILCITLSYLGFALAYLGRRGRWGLVLFFGGIGLAILAKDVLGAIGPLVVVVTFLWVTRESTLRHWSPWWGWGLFAAIVVPWFAAVETANRGYLWHMVLDTHLLNFARLRAFPDEDVPLNALQFVVVTGAAFLPWALAAPWAMARGLRRDWTRPAERIWVVFALWALLVIAFFTVSPFKLLHYGLPAFPALALLVARLWDDALARKPGSLSARALIVPIAVVFALAALAAGAAWADVLVVPRTAVTTLDLAARNLAARGQAAAERPLEAFRPVLASCAVIFATSALALAVAAWRRSVELGLTVAMAAMLAFLPAAGRGMAEFARGRSAAPIAAALQLRLGPGDVVVHEGALENSGSVLLAIRKPVHIVDGRMSNIGFGSTFTDARDVFWDVARLGEEWAAPGRRFLVSVRAPGASVVRSLPPGTVHLIAVGGGRRLYSNLADGAGPAR